MHATVAELDKSLCQYVSPFVKLVEGLEFVGFLKLSINKPQVITKISTGL